MSRFHVGLSIVVLLAAFTANGHGQVVQPWPQGNVPGYSTACHPQPAPRPVSRTVEVNVPVPCPSPAPCVPVQACGPRPCYPPVSCCPPPCPPPCPTKPVKVQVDVVVRPETPKPCTPQRYCCENPPVFEPIFYHAAWTLQSLVAAPLGLGECILGHGAIRQPVPPPVPVACIPCRVVPCPPPAPMCAPPVPHGIPQCQPPAPCRAPGQPLAHVTSCPPRKASKSVRNAPIGQ
jgi:hypothetical protein